MRNLLIEGGHLVTPLEERFAPLWIEDARLHEPGVLPGETLACERLDASGCYVCPGLIDLQVNGAEQVNFWADPTADQVLSFMQTLLRAGVTTITPTLITDSLDHLNENLDFLAGTLAAGAGQVELSCDFFEQANKIFSAQCASERLPGEGYVRMPGIHLEGPCLSPERPGVHPARFLQALTVETLDKIVRKSVILMTVAPELDPSGQCLAYLQHKGVTVSLGHSNATFAEASTAFSSGIALTTHTFNAMPPLNHRALGAAGAALLDKNVSCCLIADGLHLSPSTVELVVRLKGIERVVLVTDVAQIGTSQGGLAGSSIMLSQAVRNLVGWGVCDFREAVQMASYNAACAVGLDGCLGHLAQGSHADVVLWDKRTLEIKHVIVAGHQVF